MNYWRRLFVTVLLVTGAFVGAATLGITGVPPSAAALAAPCQPRLFQRVPPDQAPKVCPPGAATTSRSDTATVAATPEVSGFVDQTVFNGLSRPTAVRFAADGRVFVAQQDGRILVYAGLDAGAPTVFADLRYEVDDYWDRGLSGLALDPNFPASPYVYALYTYDAPIGGTAPVWNDACPTPPGATTDGCVVSGRLSRLELDPATGKAKVDAGNHPVETVLIGDQWCQQFPSHSLDDLVFGPDGMLYVSAGEGSNFDAVDYGQYGGGYAGDRANPCGDPPSGAGGTETPPDAQGGALRAQSPRRPAGQPAVLNGTILRVDPATGAGVTGNPMFASGDLDARRIVAYGLRNPYRFAFRPGTSEIWIGDVGWGTWEELDRLPNPTDAVAPDFGWPCYEGVGPQPNYQSANLAACAALYSDSVHPAVAPFFAYAHDQQVDPNDPACPPATGQSVSSAITGVAFYTANSYPAGYKNALFFADYARNCIWAMAAGAGGVPVASTVHTFVSDANGPVDLEIEPTSGDLFYVAIDSGEIHRIRYNAPVAAAGATPTSGVAPLPVQFSSAGSSGANLTYAWDFGDGQSSTAPNPAHTYQVQGTYAARLTVTDANGVSARSLPVGISAGNTPPTATITAPVPTLKWSVGDTVTFSGAGTDPQDGPLPDSAFTWTVILHHCATPDSCHTHQIQQISGAAGGSFSAPDHEYPSYLEIRLTVQDSGGLTDTASVPIYPNTVALTVASSTPGVQLAIGGLSGPAPFTRTVIVGSVNSIGAPSPQTVDGADYTFTSWSDGGAQSHTVIAGTSPATYTANWRRTTPLLALSATAGGAASAAPPGPFYRRGAVATLTATANAGYAFTGWTIDGAAAGSANPYALTMDADHAVVATFAPTRWSPWASQGGILTAAPAAASLDGRAYVFAKGSDAALYVASTADGATWSGWSRLGGVLTAAPAAAGFDGKLYAFAKGSDGALYVMSSADGAHWSGWTRLGGLLTAPPAAASAGGKLYVFAKGSDDALYVTSSTDGATFTPWRDLGGALTAAPAATGFRGQVYVFARGSDNALYETHSADGVTFAGWHDGGGILTAAPAAAAFTPAAGTETLYTFATGTDGALYERHTTDGTAWTAWQSLGGQPAGPPAAAGDGGTLFVFARGSDGALWERYLRP